MDIYGNRVGNIINMPVFLNFINEFHKIIFFFFFWKFNISHFKKRYKYFKKLTYYLKKNKIMMQSVYSLAEKF